MRKLLFLAGAVLSCAMLAHATPIIATLTSCNSQNVAPPSGAFTLEFSCTVTPVVSVPPNYGPLFDFNYTITLVSASQSFTGVSIDYADSVTFGLPGVPIGALFANGASLSFQAPGSVEGMALVTLHTSAGSFKVLVPGPVPEPSSALLALPGLLFFILRRRSFQRA